MVKHQFSTTFSQFCDVLSCPGVKDFSIATHFVGKLFWTFMLLLCFTVSFWQSYGIVNDFMSSRPYKISISKEMREDSMRYPDVIVCNFNRIKQSFVDKDNLDYKLLAYVFQLFPIIYDLPFWYFPIEDVQSYDEAWRNYSINTNNTVLDFLSTYGHSKEDTFLKVTYNANTNVGMLFEKVFTLYGLCWKLILNNTQPFPGAAAGIKMILNPQLNEYLKDVVHNNYLQEGLVLSIGFVDEPTVPRPIFLSPGTGTANSISLTTVENKVAIPYTPIQKPYCNEDTKLKIINEVYSPQNCVLDCFMQSVFEHCACIYIVNTSKPIRFCTTSTIAGCVLYRSEYVTFVTWNRTVVEAFVNCNTNCLMPCYPFKTVESAATIARYPNRNSRKSLKSVLVNNSKVAKEDNDEILDSIISVDVFFPRPEIYVAETSETYTIMGFIGNFGGQLSLWTGVSIITFVQLIYYGLIHCWNIINNLLKSNSYSIRGV